MLLLSYVGVSQSLGLNDLQNICNKKSSELVNQYLMNKGWEYFDSNKGNTEKYNTVTWAFEKSSYNDKAQGWFHLYTYEGSPNKINYSVFNKTSYGKIKKSLLSYGYKLKNDLIEDDKIKSIYENSKYRLEITTSKRKDDDFNDRSMTSYGFLLIKKSGVYDPNNGLKTTFWDGTDIPRTQYMLKNGKFHGKYEKYYRNGNKELVGNYVNDKKSGNFKEYDENGNLMFSYRNLNDKLHGELIKYEGSKIVFKKTYSSGLLNGKYEEFYLNGNKSFSGNYIKDKANGPFKEFDESGALVLTYNKVKDSLHGKMSKFENGKIKYSKNYVNGSKHGDFKEYTYDDEGELILIQKGRYSKDKRDGRWNYYSVDTNKKEKLLVTDGYKEGLLEGDFQTIKGDSIIFGNYRNDKLEGKYLVYRDIHRMFNGGMVNVDTTSNSVRIESKGAYINGFKHGEWSYYGFNDNLIEKGKYIEDKKNGEWNSYYFEKKDERTNKFYDFSRELYLTENYKNDLLDGKRICYSGLTKEYYPCKDDKDECYYFQYTKLRLEETFRRGLLQGDYILKDSTGFVERKGAYVNDQKHGEWITRNKLKDGVYEVEKGSYSNGEKEGLFEYYFNDDLSSKFLEENYQYDKLNGALKIYLNGVVTVFKNYYSGNLEFIKYFNNEKLEKSYEIISSSNNYKNIKKTRYDSEGQISETFSYYSNNEFDINFSDESFEKSLEKGDAVLDGEYKKIDIKGRVVESGEKYINMKKGIWVYNFFNQEVSRVIEYVNNKIYSEIYFLPNSESRYTGTFVFNHKEQVEEIKIKNGFRDGATIFKDLNGKKIKKIKYKEGKIKN